MNSRRDFLKLGTAVSAWAAGAAQAGIHHIIPRYGPPSLPAPGLYKVIGDQRHAVSVAFVAAARRQGLDGLLLAQGDVSKFWLHELQAAWQQTPVAVAGLTDAGPLFCLEQLGSQYGLRVVQRETVGAVEGVPLLAWLIAPKPQSLRP